LSLYADLVRKAWKSGEYSREREDAASRVPGESEARALRSFLRSRMEWVAAREAYDPSAAESRPQEEPSMKLAQFVKFREEKFGGVLFDTRSEKVFTLSPTGAAVVREIASGGADGKGVLERLKARYDDPKGKMAAEAEAFIADLREKGLVIE
jgi:hypothetical protein